MAPQVVEEGAQQQRAARAGRVRSPPSTAAEADGEGGTDEFRRRGRR